MGTLYLVRHGQASFGAADYDQLSELGAKQSARLGQYLAAKGLSFSAALCGTLRRQVDTFDGIAQGGGYTLAAQPWPALNEFDGEAIIATVHPHPLEKSTEAQRYREHFRLLRDGLRQWMNGVVSPQGMPSYQAFRQGVVEVLDHIRKHHEGNVLLVSSGGPISTAVGHVLATSPETTIELNLRIRNSSVTEFDFNPKRHNLVSYNGLPHLDQPELADWITYS
ncbi:histidine phosphatase family protein [Rhodoferax sp.]|uniref:histidine phosphatase family protein n=1 Tax=Rhodoferax sp. TaxID=50421 RepID=UPI0027585CFE|nr:histidine phosphatase family protein [Rhodoferax sp.]